MALYSSLARLALSPAAVLSLMVGAQGADFTLVPHRAVYELSLLRASGSDAPADAKGRIVYELTGNACEGYVTNFRQITEMTPQEGQTRTADTRSNTYESADGKTFRFRIETLSDGQVTKTIEGSADRSAAGGFSIALKQPDLKKVDLGDDVAFPMQQTLRSLEAAKEGRTTFEMTVYDGSDTGLRLYHSFNIVGKAVQRPVDDVAGDEPSMKTMARWPVTSSFFDLGKADGAPVYVLSFDLWENGVSSNLKLDYGEFVLAGKLTQLEMLKPTECKK